jgi:hypothetical protein
MDLSAIIVIIVSTALFLGSIVWLEIHSRRNQSPDRNDSGIESTHRSKSVSKNGKIS